MQTSDKEVQRQSKRSGGGRNTGAENKMNI